MEIKLRLIDQLRWCGEPIRGQRLHVLVTALVTAGRGGASSAALIDAIWGENSPANPHKALQILISRLRAATTAHIVQRTATGYRFGLEPGEVDLLAREDLVKSAQAALDSGDFPRALTQAHAAADFEPHLRARRVAALAACSCRPR